jgi:hypothetical protein
MSFNFWDVNWGPDEAKDDAGLLEYFYEIPQYKLLLTGEKRFLIGRKGTGKTAILQRLKFESETDPKKFIKELTLREFPISDLRALRDKSMQDKSQYVNIWTFLILVELAKLVVEDNGITDSTKYKELRDFISRNFPSKIGGFIETVKYLKSNSNKVSILPSFLGASRENSSQEGVEVSVHYSKVVDYLQQSLAEVQSESMYIILFDELDEGYKASDSNKRLLLLSLFRSVENLALYYKRANIKFRPVLAIRSDIYDNLEDNDLNKYDDYIIRLNWQADDNTNLSLKNLVNKRIDSSIITLDGSDSWFQVVNDYDKRIYGSNKSVWAYIKNRSFERPRDIIKYMKKCKELAKNGKLEWEDVKNVEVGYSSWFFKEFRDEVQSHLPVWKSVMGCLQDIGKGRLQPSELIAAMEKEPEIVNYLEQSNSDVHDIIKILFDYSVIGNLDNGKRWVFKYKDPFYRYSENKELIVHFGFEKKLLILK